MPETKKLLVAFNPEKPDAESSDFLIPWNQEGQFVFLGLKSGKQHRYGMIAFVGRSISVNDLFARLVDSGAFIPNVDEMLASLQDYVEQLQAFRIGNVVRITRVQGNNNTFGLALVARTPSTAKGADSVREARP